MRPVDPFGIHVGDAGVRIVTAGHAQALEQVEELPRRHADGLRHGVLELTTTAAYDATGVDGLVDLVLDDLARIQSPERAWSIRSVHRSSGSMTCPSVSITNRPLLAAAPPGRSGPGSLRRRVPAPRSLASGRSFVMKGMLLAER